MILGEDKRLLKAVPSMEKVHRVVVSVDGDSTVGLDGFTGKFFYLCVGCYGSGCLKYGTEFFLWGRVASTRYFYLDCIDP